MLSPEQLAARKGKLTASRVKTLMNGDAEEWKQLYLELTEDPSFIPEDKEWEWPIFHGARSEAHHLDWYEHEEGALLTRRGEVVVHPRYSWAAATLDGWDDRLPCVVECKLVGGREPIEVIIERYQPQCQWLMEVTGTKTCALSVIMGASPPRIEFIDRAQDYINEMLKRGAAFMRCVQERRLPIALLPVPAPIIAEKIIDMSASEIWQRRAEQWLQCKGAAETVKECEKILKSIVPADAAKAFGHGIRITRDKANRLSLREDTK